MYFKYVFSGNWRGNHFKWCIKIKWHFWLLKKVILFPYNINVCGGGLCDVIIIE